MILKVPGDQNTALPPFPILQNRDRVFGINSWFCEHRLGNLFFYSRLRGVISVWKWWSIVHHRRLSDTLWPVTVFLTVWDRFTGAHTGWMRSTYTRQVTGWRARHFAIPKWFEACTSKYFPWWSLAAMGSMIICANAACLSIKWFKWWWITTAAGAGIAHY